MWNAEANAAFSLCQTTALTPYLSNIPAFIYFFWGGEIRYFSTYYIYEVQHEEFSIVIISSSLRGNISQPQLRLFVVQNGEAAACSLGFSLFKSPHQICSADILCCLPPPHLCPPAPPPPPHLPIPLTAPYFISPCFLSLSSLSAYSAEDV